MNKSFVYFGLFYFLVIFVGLIGFFWQDNRFFVLAFINLLFLIISFSFYRNLSKKQKSLDKEIEENKHQDKSLEPIFHGNSFVKHPSLSTKKEKKVWQSVFVLSVFFLIGFTIDYVFFHLFGNFVFWVSGLFFVLFLSFAKKLLDNKIKLGANTLGFYSFLFLISIVVSLFVYYTLPFNFIPFVWLLSVGFSFLFYMVFYVVFKNQGINKFFTQFYVRVYVSLICLLFGIIVFQVKNNRYLDVISQDLDKLSMGRIIYDNKDPLPYTGNGEVLATGLLEQFSGLDLINESDLDVKSGSFDSIDSTGSVLATGFDNTGFNESFLSSTGQNVEPVEDSNDLSTTSKNKLGIKDSKSLTMMDAIVYLLDINQTSLSTQKDINFRYVTTKNPYYSYWRTAYQKKLIGQDTSPSKLVMCETYFTLKGLLEGRDVSYKASNVKTAFWQEAKKEI